MRLLLQSRSVMLALLLAVIVAGYLGFRYFYGISSDYPFSQEILLVFIGAIATVLITALLLNQQTELELRKEGQVLLLERKSAAYAALIEHLGDIVEKGRLSAPSLAELRVLNHKMAMVASAEVIRQFGKVLARLDEAARDRNIARAEQERIMRAVAVLTWHMRRDLLGRIPGEDDDALLQDILSNNADVEGQSGHAVP